MDQITVLAQTKEIDTVTDFIDAILERIDCPVKAQMQVNVAIDEIFSNIANYAYEDGLGEVVIKVEELKNNTGVRVSFSDSGKPYNPLEMEDPDITLSAEERPIGGLGVYIVKKTMDSVEYEYADGHNILTFTKNF